MIDSYQPKSLELMGSWIRKTTLISVCKQLNIQDEISSPTFSIVNTYSSPKGPVYHFDFYRLKNTNEVYDFGLEEYLDSGHFCFLEWAEKILTFLKTMIILI